MKASSLPRQLLGDTALYGLAGALGKGLGVLTVPVLSRALGPADYGLVDLALSFSFIVTLVSSFSGDMAVARAYARTESTRLRGVIVTSWIAATAVVSVAMAMALIPVAATFADDAWGTQGAQGPAFVALALVPVSAVQAALASVMRVVREPRAAAAAAIVDLLAQVGLAILFAALGLGPTGVLIGYLIGSTIGLLVALRSAWRYMLPSIDGRVALRLVAAGVPYLPLVSAPLLVEYAIRPIAVDALGREAAGFIAVGLRLASILNLAAAAFSLAWAPMGLAMQESRRTYTMFSIVLDGFTVAIGCAAIVMSALSLEVVTLVSGPAFAEAAGIVPGLAAAAALTGALHILAVAAGVATRSGLVALATSVGAVIQLVITVWGLTAMGELDAVGWGAVGGRLTSIALLAYAIRHTAVVGSAFTIVSFSTAGAALLLQSIARESGTTSLARYAIAVATGVLSVVALRLWLLPRLARVDRERVLPKGMRRDQPDDQPEVRLKV